MHPKKSATFRPIGSLHSDQSLLYAEKSKIHAEKSKVEICSIRPDSYAEKNNDLSTAQRPASKTIHRF